MASSDKSKPKPKVLKAKKTMPTSCRKQAEMLSKPKHVEALRPAAAESNVTSGNLSLNNDFITSACRHSKNFDFSLDSSKTTVPSQRDTVFPQSLMKPVEEIVHSENRLHCTSNEQVTCSNQKPRESAGPAGDLCVQKAKESRVGSENHFEYQTCVTSSFFELKENYNVKSSWWPPSILGNILQMPSTTITNTADDERLNNMVSPSEKTSNSESSRKRQPDILSSDSDFVPAEKRPRLNSVSSSVSTAEDLKNEEYNKTCYFSISNCERTETKWQSPLDTDNIGQNQKRRMFSGKEDKAKHMRASEQINGNILPLERQTALLQQVRHLIQQEINSIHFKLFDDKLKELNERIGKTHCKIRHDTKATELFTKIARLQRRVHAVLSFQRNHTEPNVSSNTTYKVANSETVNLAENQSVKSLSERTNSAKHEASSPLEKASENIALSADHVEFVSESNNDDVMLISVENPNLTAPITSKPTDLRKVPSTGNSSSSLNADTEVTATELKKLDSIIDLTKEGLSSSNSDTRSPVSTSESVLKTTPEAPNAAKVLDSFAHLPPLPEPPPLLPELVDKVRDTLPPQKPELKVKRVLRPKGIALTWNISKINPKCAPVESYHLFLCHENASNKLIWKKIGEIKALPLPMACTLSQFLASNKYYFTVQSKDIFGRYGPFCDIKSIPGFSENLT